MSIRFQSWRDDWPMNFLLTKREIIKVERFLAMVAQQTNTAFSLKLYADFLDAYTNTSPDGGVLSKRWAFHADETALALCIRSVAITIVKSEAGALIQARKSNLSAAGRMLPKGLEKFQPTSMTGEL